MILLLLIYQTLGATEKDILNALKTDKTIQWTVFGIALLILFAGFGHVLGQKALSVTQSEDTTTVVTEGGVATGSYSQNVAATIFDPKVLGMVFIFLIAIFAVAFLSGG